jgi:hypothetical protein
VAGANDATVSARARAARSSLDLGFLHPFDDGNARAARVALDFVLTRAGLVLADDEGWAFRPPLAADDPALGSAFEQIVTRLARRVPGSHEVPALRRGGSKRLAAAKA